MLWDFVYRINTLLSSNSTSVVLTLEIIHEKMHKELSMFMDRSTCTSSWIRRSHEF